MGPVTVKLKPPKTWRIHPVFHLFLVSLYRTTLEYRPNYISPLPVTIEGEDKWEIESIINHRKLAQGGLQYLVTWTNGSKKQISNMHKQFSKAIKERTR